MNPFAYARPDRVDQAVAVGADPGTMFLAGGTELLNWMRLGIVAPERVVDISRISELGRIEPLAGGGLRMGALVKLNDAAQHPAVMRDYPVTSRPSGVISSSGPAVPTSAPKRRSPATSACPVRAARHARV
jgi:xanthine dehydrogenase YagS FAD-binding subunit